MKSRTNPDSWYDLVQGESIEQGDILRDFEIVVPSHVTGDSIDVEVKTFDVIVMTQTCDIAQGKVPSLLLCPVWDLWKFVDAAKQSGVNWGSDQREALRRGNLPGYHLVNEANLEGFEMGLSIVDFHEVYTAPSEQVRIFASKIVLRLRLCSPYKEHLAQAFARFFMRVGLPVDIPRDKLRKSPN